MYLGNLTNALLSRYARLRSRTEHGRAVLWGQALDMRRDLSGLADAAPDQAHRLARIREVLDNV